MTPQPVLPRQPIVELAEKTPRAPEENVGISSNIFTNMSAKAAYPALLSTPNSEAATAAASTSLLSISPSEHHGAIGKQAVSMCIEDLCCALRMQVQTVRRSFSCLSHQPRNLEDSPDNMLARLLMMIDSFQNTLQDPPHRDPVQSCETVEGQGKDLAMNFQGANCQSLMVNRLGDWIMQQDQLTRRVLEQQQQLMSKPGLPHSPTFKAPSSQPSRLKSASTSIEESDEARKTAARAMRDSVIEDDNQKPVAPWRRQTQLMVSSYSFECFFAVLIATNAVFMGAEVDYRAGHANPGDDTPLVMTVIRHSYSALFLIELVLRAVADGCPGFFFSAGDAWAWNCLDLFLVICSFVEVVLELIETADEGGGINMSNVRAIRMIRLIRLLRIVRITRIVRFVRALRTLVYSIICTLKSLVWSMVLLVIIIYVYAILFTQAACDHLLDESIEGNVELERFWGSLAKGMYTLFKCISNGVDWDDVVRPLSFYWLWPALFTGYIAFAYFAVLNVVTGVFCQSAIESAQHDHDMIMAAMTANKSMYAKRAMQLFKSIDADRSGELTITELEGHLTHPDVREYFMSLEIEPEDAWTLFKLIDVDETNVIDLEEFVLGCLRLKGAARSIDVAKLMYDHKWVMKRVGELIACTMKLTDTICPDGKTTPLGAGSTVTSPRSPRPPEQTG